MCDRGDVSVDVLDGLASLVDIGLVRTMAGEEDRFSMLETIREFGQEKLKDSREAEDIRRAHAAFFCQLAEEAEPHLDGAEPKQWLDRLEMELTDVRAALDWSASMTASLHYVSSRVLGGFGTYVATYLKVDAPCNTSSGRLRSHPSTGCEPLRELLGLLRCRKITSKRRCTRKNRYRSLTASATASKLLVHSSY